MDILPQILVNGVIAGCVMALVALGLSLIFGVLTFMNFAHGEMAMVGAILYYFFFIEFAWPIIPSTIVSVALVGVLAVLYNKGLFEPLRKQNPWTLMVISVGVSLFTKASVTLFAGEQAKSYSREGYETDIYNLFDGAAVITDYQVFIIIATVVILVGLATFLKYSKTGKAIRAVSDNMDLSEVVGIDSKRIITIIFVISSCIAAFAGILIGYEQNVTPHMGLFISVYAFVAVVLGGLGSIWGAVFGAMILGVLQNLIVGLDWFGYSIPTSYKSSVAFGLLIILLVFRPRGLFGPSLEEHMARK